MEILKEFNRRSTEMGDANIVRVNDMFREHLRLENEIYERFQALTRRNSVEEMQNRMMIIIEEYKNREQDLERRIDSLKIEGQKLEREKQILQIENARIQERLADEQEQRRRCEHDCRDTIAGLESSAQTLERRIMTLETKLQEAESNQRQRAESDAERICTLREEIAISRRELEQEKVDRRIDCTKLQNELTVTEKCLKDSEQENNRLRERIDRIENELERKQQTLLEFREEISNARTEKTRLEIQMTDQERQYTERMTEKERESLKMDQELRELKQRFDEVLIFIEDYIRRNGRTNVELGRLRERLDQVDREQKDNSDQLENNLQKAKANRSVRFH